MTRHCMYRDLKINKCTCPCALSPIRRTCTQLWNKKVLSLESVTHASKNAPMFTRRTNTILPVESDGAEKKHGCKNKSCRYQLKCYTYIGPTPCALPWCGHAYTSTWSDVSGTPAATAEEVPSATWMCRWKQHCTYCALLLLLQYLSRRQRLKQPTPIT